MSLKVVDRMFCPHDEHGIAFRARIFGVEKLDWKFLDMAISYLTDRDLELGNERAPPERITEIHLYSSGKRGPVEHWMGHNGIKALQNLKKLYIHLIMDIASPSLLGRLEAIICRGIEGINADRVAAKLSKIELQFEQQPWNTASTTDMKSLKEIAERAFPEIYPSIEDYTNHFSKIDYGGMRLRRTRVAILDSGILSLPVSRSDAGQNRGMWPRIVQGESFVQDANRRPPWQLASDAHGTQIAKVINAIDPHCDIYVAQVTEGRHGIVPDNVAQAIQWAVEKDVDVISMSLAIPQNGHHNDYVQNLKFAVDAADKCDIVQLCSHHDEGWNVTESWPANCPGVKVIVACNEYGAFTERVSSCHDYQIPGINIFTGTVPYLESEDTMSGSSVATAIAAGLASLVLSCHRLRHGPDDGPNFRRKEFVENAFAAMSTHVNNMAGGNSNYLRLENFEKFAKAEGRSGEREYPWFT